MQAYVANYLSIFCFRPMTAKLDELWFELKALFMKVNLGLLVKCEIKIGYGDTYCDSRTRLGHVG